MTVIQFRLGRPSFSAKAGFMNRVARAVVRDISTFGPAPNFKGKILKKRSRPLICQSSSGGGSGEGGNISRPTGGSDDESEGSRRNLQIATYIFAGLLFVGGLMGYVKRKSKMSILSSSIVALVLVACAYRFASPNARTYLIVALVATLSLSGFFYKRYSKSRKPFPGLVGSVLSVIMSGLYISQLM